MYYITCCVIALFAIGGAFFAGRDEFTRSFFAFVIAVILTAIIYRWGLKP